MMNNKGSKCIRAARIIDVACKTRMNEGPQREVAGTRVPQRWQKNNVESSSLLTGQLKKETF